MPDPSAWRIDRLKWADSSFDGSGAAKEGGRWNSPGVRVVYCSRNLAMAVQEQYIHLPKPVPRTLQLVKFRIEFGKLAMATIFAADLPDNWAVFPPAEFTQQMGDAWAASGRTSILAVPSALIPEEVNYLLNPQHRDFPRIVVSPAQPFALDGRIARLQEPPVFPP